MSVLTEKTILRSLIGSVENVMSFAEQERTEATQGEIVMYNH